MRKFIIAGLLSIGGLLTINAQCKTVKSLVENFDTWKDIHQCWDTKSGLAMLYAKDKKVTFYSMVTPREDMYLITPKIKAGNYTLTLDISDNGGETSLELFSIQNTSDKKTFASIAKPSKITGAKRIQNITLKKDAHLGMKVLLNGIHQAVYIDNLSLKPRK